MYACFIQHPKDEWRSYSFTSQIVHSNRTAKANSAGLFLDSTAITTRICPASTSADSRPSSLDPVNRSHSNCRSRIPPRASRELSRAGAEPRGYQAARSWHSHHPVSRPTHRRPFVVSPNQRQRTLLRGRHGRWGVGRRGGIVAWRCGRGGL